MVRLTVGCWLLNSTCSSTAKVSQSAHKLSTSNTAGLKTLMAGATKVKEQVTCMHAATRQKRRIRACYGELLGKATVLQEGSIHNLCSDLP